MDDKRKSILNDTVIKDKVLKNNMLKNDVFLTKEESELFKEFKNILYAYEPDWNVIAKNLTQSNGYNLTEIMCERIRLFRINEGNSTGGLLTQSELGDILGLKKQTISKMESGLYKKPPIEHIKKISLYFDIETEYFFGFGDSEYVKLWPHQVYFMECPDSKYYSLNDKLKDQKMIKPIRFNYYSRKKLIEELSRTAPTPLLNVLHNLTIRVNKKRYNLNEITKIHLNLS